MLNQMVEWKKRPCIACGRDFFIRTDWLSPHETCDYCRAKTVENIIQKLKNYMRNREKYDSKPISSPIDNLILQKDIELRARIGKILSKSNLDYIALISEILEDRQIRKLILRIDKECKINDKTKKRYAQQKTGKMALTSNVRFVQGGSPGLGKKA